MATKFGLRFDIMTRDMVEASRTGNPFLEKQPPDRPGRPALAQRGAQAKLEHDRLGPRHRRRGPQDVGPPLRQRGGARRSGSGSASSLRDRTRHLLLLTATPHNGKDEDFLLFMSLLDPDRFAGRLRNDEAARRAPTSCAGW